MKTKYSATNKHLSRDEIIKLVKNQLHNDVAVKAMKHLQSCTFCNEAYEGLKQLPDISVLHTLNVQWKSKTVRKRKFTKLEVNLQSLYILLIITGLIALAIIFLFFFI
jgi:hypothetical protein